MIYEFKHNWNAFLAYLYARRTRAYGIIGIAVVCTLGISFLFPLEYRAQTRLLVVLDNELNLDSFAASRSAERVAYNLSRIVKSDSFLERVRSTSYSLGSTYPTDVVKRRDYWDRKIDAGVAPGTSILEIKAYDEDKQIAQATVSAVSEVLALQGGIYHGGGDKVRIQVIDFPWVSRFPVRPNLILSAILGILIGCVATFIYMGQQFRRLMPHYGSSRVSHTSS